MSWSPHVFEDMFKADDDPWGFRTRWYEQRKRQLTVACLPAQRYARAYEPGCANGELSAALADRCDRLLVSDAADSPVRLAKQRLEGYKHVDVLRATVPDDWPDGRFDLIVISELGYYLSGGALVALAAKARESLDPSGVVLACHWRHPIQGCACAGAEVHSALATALGMENVVHLIDADFVIDVWSRA